MMIIFATIVVDPGQRDEIAEKMSARLEVITPKQNGAVSFELLLNASDPSRLHVFQTWESEETFRAWGAVDTHLAFQAEFAGLAKEFSSLQYVGATEVGKA